MPHVQVRSIAEQITSRLRGEILSGQYEPGTPLREEGLAQRFGVSRMPIRNVLQQLMQEGLLVARRNCGATVAPRPGDLVKQILNPIRVQIETYALRICLPRMTAEQFERLQAIIDAMALAGRQKDDAALIDSDRAFHEFLLTAAGLDDIVPVWKATVGRTRDFQLRKNQALPDYEIVPFGHKMLLDVFRAGDVEAAVEAHASLINNGEFSRRAIEAWKAARRRPGP
jgi:DNA-binding GntR family transcriptional regulator